MKSVAIIAEYNPFHNGHVYQAAQARQQSDADVVIAVMSGQFTQRGEPACTNKFLRAQMALKSCDLIIELPQFYALSYADDFARGALAALKLFNIDALSFGAETPDLSLLQRVAQQGERNKGESYARQMALNAVSEPNNILARQYIRYADPAISLYPVRRINNHYHDQQITSSIASATAIRTAIAQSQDISGAVPIETVRLLNSPIVTWESFFPLLKYKLITSSLDELSSIYMMTEGLEYRLKDKIRDASCFDDFMQQIKTKRYTYTRLQRLCAYVLLNIKSVQAHPVVTDVRVLAMNDIGRQYLKQLNDPNIHTLTNKKNRSHFQLEIMSTMLYNMQSQHTMTDFNTPVIYSRT